MSDVMYYMRTVSDDTPIKGLWTNLEKAKDLANTYSTELQEVVLVYNWDGKLCFNTDPKLLKEKSS